MMITSAPRGLNEKEYPPKEYWFLHKEGAEEFRGTVIGVNGVYSDVHLTQWIDPYKAQSDAMRGNAGTAPADPQ